MYLCEVIKSLKNINRYHDAIPSDVLNNLNSDFAMRDYQNLGFCNYITYYEELLGTYKGIFNDYRSVIDPNNMANLHYKFPDFSRSFLFHMATGSGKTYMMAGIILYLYTMGYRNFVFFVNSTNIIQKTKDNFLNKSSSKYLFNNNIVINGNNININEVNNFQFSQNSNDINIVFTTIQALHTDLFTPKENSLTFDDFERSKICFISDESHHLYASTKKQKGLNSCNQNKAINGLSDSSKSWEDTVTKLLNTSPDHLMIEFTATCDYKNDVNIKSVAEPKLGYEYTLTNFYNDLYCKRIEAIEVVLEDRILIALMINQYKQIIFNNNNLAIKPVILFKTDNQQCKEFDNIYLPLIENLSSDNNADNGQLVRRIFDKYKNSFDVLSDLDMYLKSEELEDWEFANILSKNFSKEKCLVANTENYQTVLPYLNSLENIDNPYRVVFECKRLDEGWDVLNLFDIVRVYDNKSASKTVLEAQLLGRGARYCPFVTPTNSEKFRRKFDNDLSNELAICENLYYFCTPDNLYIRDLRTELHDLGIDIKTNTIGSNTVNKTVKLKESFKKTSLYEHGFIFTNRREIKYFKDSIPTNFFKIEEYNYDAYQSNISNLMNLPENESNTENLNLINTELTFKEINDQYHYNVLYFYFSKYGMNFSKCKQNFPDSNFRTLKSFLTDPKWLGSQKIKISTKINYSNGRLPISVINKALDNVMPNIINNLEKVKNKQQIGTKRFDNPVSIKNQISDFSINVIPISGSVGVSQSDNTCNDYSLILNASPDSYPWHVYEDNLGTSEEKKLVHEIAHDSEWQKILQKYENEIFLIRNEEKIPIYSFDDGQAFYPDYVLIARKFDPTTNQISEQIQIFIEPKGEGFIANDKWKEDFLVQILNDSQTHCGYKGSFNSKTMLNLPSSVNYKIFGVSFYNRDLSEQHDHFNKDILGTPNIL